MVLFDVQGVKNFERIVNNVGAQLRLPKEDIEGLKLCATGGKRYLLIMMTIMMLNDARLIADMFQQARLFGF